LAKELLEEVSFAARESEFVDAKSGVSTRLSISAMENLVAAAQLRLVESAAQKTQIRLLDFMAIIPSITGKIELVYEGEQEGADEVARLLIDRAVESQFEKIFPKIAKLEKDNERKYYSDLIDWFDSDFVELNESDSDADFREKLSSIQPLQKLVAHHAAQFHEIDQRFCMEVFLWGLTVKNKLDRSENQLTFKISSLGFSHF
jgi:magnesium chelatase subunit I